ncbi:MAG TPA: hypothetical protein VMT85_02780 [Thermoanaerobaculia bacterium]|nr:hypothetical protein [Thermoanaerobaculia bacterium]
MAHDFNNLLTGMGLAKVYGVTKSHRGSIARRLFGFPPACLAVALGFAIQGPPLAAAAWAQHSAEAGSTAPSPRFEPMPGASGAREPELRARLERAEDPSRVAMGHAAGEPHLPPEALGRLLEIAVLPGIGEQLEGDAIPHLLVHHRPDRPHRAATDQALDSVAAGEQLTGSWLGEA